MGAIYVGNTRISPFTNTSAASASNFVSFIVYTNNNLQIANSTINGVSYTTKTLTLDGHDILIAIVPKNIPFSYSIGGGTWSNGSGTLTLDNNYILELIPS